MNIQKKYLPMLLICWFLSLTFLFYIVEQEKPANQKFTFIKLFYSPKTKQSIPLMPELQRPFAERIEEVEYGEPLLSKGYEAGAGTIGKVQIDYKAGEAITIILPYKGTLKSYNNSDFMKGSVRARILHFPGKWNATFLQQRFLEGYCARLIQMAAHKDELRVSISASYGIFAVEEEVRYTDSEIIIHVRQQQRIKRISSD